MNSTFRAHWLASSEVISQVLFTSEQPKENKLAFVGIHCIVTNKVTLWATSYSACVVYTKTIIHLSVGGWIFTSPLRGLVNIHFQAKWKLSCLLSFKHFLQHARFSKLGNIIEKFTAWQVNSSLNFTWKTDIARIAKRWVRYRFFKWNLTWNSLIRLWIFLESHS